MREGIERFPFRLSPDEYAKSGLRTYYDVFSEPERTNVNRELYVVMTANHDDKLWAWRRGVFSRPHRPWNLYKPRSEFLPFWPVREFCFLNDHELLCPNRRGAAVN